MNGSSRHAAMISVRNCVACNFHTRSTRFNVFGVLFWRIINSRWSRISTDTRHRRGFDVQCQTRHTTRATVRDFL